MTLDGKTWVYGVVGYPISHSLSPVFQNQAFRHFSINAVYVPFEVKPEDFERAFLGLKALGVKGVNITLPHKEKVLDFVDFLDEHVKAIGAANTVKFTEEASYAYNTDWIGFLRAAEKLVGDLKGIRVLVLGAGGSSRAILYGLQKKEARVFLWNRTRDKAYKLCQVFGCNVVEKPEEVISKVDFIVNTTSAGLRDDDPPLFDYNLLHPEQKVMDIIYKETPLLRTAREKGCSYLDGLDMLLYQGIESFKIWTGLEVPYKVVKEAILNYQTRTTI